MADGEFRKRMREPGFTVPERVAVVLGSTASLVALIYQVITTGHP